MAEQVLMLALSPTMEEGTIVSWHKQEGDPVAQSDIICEVETDKATMEYESVNEGTLLKILVPEGGQAKVGDPIAVVGESGEDISSLVEEAREKAKGDSAGQTAEAEEASEAKGTAGAEEASEEKQPAEAAPSAGVPSAGAAPSGEIKASPLARKMAGERGIDLRSLSGSGPAGRIVKRDIEKALQRGAAHGPAAAAGRGGPAAFAPAGMAAAAAGPTASGKDESVPVSGKRKIIARRLSDSKYSAPHYYLRIDVDAGPMMAARQRLNARLPKESGGKVSPNSFLIKFVAEALKRYPAVNSSWQGDTILRFGRIDVALAVAQEDGLITPVVRDCGAKGIVQIDRELRVLIDKALANKLSPEEYNGATFTISSLGISGILEFTAIINPPGSAILAVGRIHKVPVVEENGSIGVRSQMMLTLSCDHRVIDGAVGAAFLSDLKAMIEYPIDHLYG
ncbi:MAG: pyruvate dehydrogenase complex dihydrolipoamide acetyltransferase [Spirochaetales bacterium]|nr:pyruvate dehydrogenase complex dihydrolipoamide acetyltransferase [Spirochaetales bacterium]